MQRAVKTAILPVAGPGTRFRPAATSVPEAAATLVDRPAHPESRAMPGRAAK